jgi:hypothetical protein
MTYQDALKRAVATFVFGALGTPVGSAVLDVAAWKVAVASGISAVINWAYRTAEAYLKGNA